MMPNRENLDKPWPNPGFSEDLHQSVLRETYEHRQAQQVPRPSYEHLEKLRAKDDEVTPESMNADVEAAQLERRNSFKAVSGEGPAEPPEGEVDGIDMQKAVESFRSVYGRRREQDSNRKSEEAVFAGSLGATHYAAAIISALHKLEELSKASPEQLPDGYILQQGSLAVAGLARNPNAEDYAASVVEAHQQYGPEEGRKLSMRLFDSLEMLELAYGKLNFTNDEAADETRFKEFVQSYCHSKIFESEEGLEATLDIVRSSYLVLRCLAGPEATSHQDLIVILNKFRNVVLNTGVGISESDERNLDNYRLLAWQNWPDL